MRGTLTGQRYVDDILRPHVGPFLNGLPGAIFQQDNARPHTARVAQDFLRYFQTLPWPQPICPPKETALDFTLPSFTPAAAHFTASDFENARVSPETKNDRKQKCNWILKFLQVGSIAFRASSPVEDLKSVKSRPNSTVASTSKDGVIRSPACEEEYCDPPTEEWIQCCK
ncbi:DDE_3 domain-containing protein [Trichonephila clavipes]|nr:DDE_3 domain-containing protein [Trichonephila clavipes]